MAASEGMHAFGFLLERSENGSSYSEVLEIVNCNSPERLRAAAKATHNGSPDQYTEAKPGIKSTGPLMFTLNYRADQYEILEDDFEAGTELYWRISFPLDEGETTPARFVVRGFVKKLGQQKFDPEDTSVIVYDVEIERAHSKPAFTAGV